MRGERGDESGAQLGTTLRITLVFVLQLQSFTVVWTFGCSHLVGVRGGGGSPGGGGGAGGGGGGVGFTKVQ
jgi:hypothetical protein